MKWLWDHVKDRRIILVGTYTVGNAIDIQNVGNATDIQIVGIGNAWDLAGKEWVMFFILFY